MSRSSKSQKEDLSLESSIPTSSIGRPIVNDSGDIVEFMGAAIDITEQAEARAALLKAFAEIEKSEDQLRTIINTIPAGVWSASPDGTVEFFNQRCLDYTGLAPGHAAGGGGRGVIHPGDLDRMSNEWRNAITSGESVDIECRLRRFDGEYRWFLVRANPLRDELGNIVKWFAINTDIDDRKQAEEQLRRNEESLRLQIGVLQYMPAVAWTVLPDGTTDFANQQWLEYTGQTLDYVRSSPAAWVSALHPDDRERAAAAFWEGIRSGGGFTMEARFRRISDGEYRWHLNRAIPLRDSAGNLIKFVGTSTDIEDVKRADEALQHERDRLRLLLDLNNQVASHLDLRQLFRAISSALFRVFKCHFVGLAWPDASGKYLRQQMVDFPDSKGQFKEGALYPIEASPSGAAFRSAKPVVVNNLSEVRSIWSSDEAYYNAVMNEGPPSSSHAVNFHLRSRKQQSESKSLDRRQILTAGAGGVPEQWPWPGFQSGCFLPMISEGRVLGVLQITSRDESSFAEQDVEFLEQIARQIAVPLKNALEYEQVSEIKARLRDENLALREQIDQAFMFEEIVGSSPVVQAVLERVVKVAPTDSTVLISGETGTGKELIARAIHKRSKRSGQAFISVNCASIPPSLIASELFGHEKGAFTGALQQRHGRFELANRGTIFLDEIGELPAETQIALLRVLQERQFERVGASKTISVDVRVIAATNRDLSAAITAGTFRADLFYRLNVFPLQVPPLRKRKEDIPMLIEYFVKRFSQKMGKQIGKIDKKTFELCQNYPWPGNIRELQNIVERSIILSAGDTFSIDEAWLTSKDSRPEGSSFAMAETLRSQEKEIIQAALTECNGRVAGPRGAAAKLGIPPSTLDRKIQLLKINKYRFMSNSE